jgi:hypothetical protein
MKKKLYGGNARLPSPTEAGAKNPKKSVVTDDGIICANKKHCGGVPQQKEAFPKNGGSTCKICLNAEAKIKRDENRDNW